MAEDRSSFRGLSLKSVEKNKRSVENNILADIEGLAKIYTDGFSDDGSLEHNMPCPVCLKKSAKYEQISGKFVFGPCTDCSNEGFKIVKKTSWFV